MKHTGIYVNGSKGTTRVSKESTIYDLEGPKDWPRWGVVNFGGHLPRWWFFSKPRLWWGARDGVALDLDTFVRKANTDWWRKVAEFGKDFKSSARRSLIRKTSFRNLFVSYCMHSTQDVVPPLGVEKRRELIKSSGAGIFRGYEDYEREEDARINEGFYRRMGHEREPFSANVDAAQRRLMARRGPMLEWREHAYIAHLAKIEEERNYFYLDVYSAISLLIGGLNEKLLTERRMQDFKDSREWMEREGLRKASGRFAVWEQMIRDLPEEAVNNHLELLRELELDRKREKVAQGQRVKYAKLLATAFNGKAARQREQFKQYIEQKIDHFYIIYLLESGRNIDEWFEDTWKIIQCERARAQKGKDGEVPSSSEEARLEHLTLFEIRRKEKVLRDARETLGDMGSKARDIGEVVVVPDKILENEYWEAISKELGTLKKYFSQEECVFLDGKRPVFLILFDIVELIERAPGKLEASEGRKKKGVSDVEKDFKDLIWRDIGAILLREEIVEGVGREIAFLCLSLLENCEKEVDRCIK